MVIGVSCVGREYRCTCLIWNGMGTRILGYCNASDRMLEPEAEMCVHSLGPRYVRLHDLKRGKFMK